MGENHCNFNFFPRINCRADVQKNFKFTSVMETVSESLPQEVNGVPSPLTVHKKLLKNFLMKHNVNQVIRERRWGKFSYKKYTYTFFSHLLIESFDTNVQVSSKIPKVLTNEKFKRVHFFRLESGK